MSQQKKARPTTGSARSFDGRALIADPIYRYGWFTVPIPGAAGELTEKDLIDSPWVQRLRRIYQLQSARWVYPAAEHSRFQHSLGTMHLAGDFGRQLHPSLKETCPDAPSINYVEELLRVAGLLHDVGHGPYGHFFDENYLEGFGLNHEILGQAIIRKKLGKIIRAIRRSPAGDFEPGEAIDPGQIAFLIRMPSGEMSSFPKWLQLLRQVFSGIYTADNLDYVQRDAFMTGFSIDIVDIPRLRFYTFFTDRGLTLHEAGISALRQFLNARLNLYTNVYYHRTTRALDLHLQEIFRDTMRLAFPFDPAGSLDEYLECDEWSLHEIVKGWLKGRDSRKKRLALEWRKLHERKVKWKMSFSAELSIAQIQRGVGFSLASDYEQRIRASMKGPLRKLNFKVDLATQDPRPLNPVAEGDKTVNLYNPATGKTSPEPLRDIYRFIPARIVHLRAFSLDHRHDRELTQAAEAALQGLQASDTTNI